MDSKNIISVASILKRSSCINSVSESTCDNDKLYRNLIDAINFKNGNNLSKALNSYLENMCNKQVASTYYEQLLELLEMTKDNIGVYNKIVSEFTTRIIPYIDEPDKVSSVIERFNISGNTVATILEAVTTNLVANRILLNHENISKKYNIDSMAKRVQSSGLKPFVEFCATSIDNYKIKNYQKYNITLEETYYVLEKNGYKYDKSELVKLVSEYYLIRKDDMNMDTINKVIEESYVVSSSDVKNISFISESTDDNVEEDVPVMTMTIDGIINTVMDNNSDYQALNFIDNNIKSCTKDDIVYNACKLVLFLNDISNHLADSDVYKHMEFVIDYIIDSAYKFETFSREDITELIYSLDRTKNDIVASNSIKGIKDDEYAAKLEISIQNLEYCRNSLYTEDNLLAMSNVDACDEGALTNLILSGTTSALNAAKIGAKTIGDKVKNKLSNIKSPFKCHNLITATINLDKFLKKKEKKVYNKIQSGLSKFVKSSKNILFGESIDYRQYIGEDNRVCIPVKQYIFTEDEEYDLSQFLIAVCSEYNYILDSENNENIRVYYEIAGNIATIYIKDSNVITEEVLEESANAEKNYSEIDLYIEEFCKIQDAMRLLEGRPLVSVEELVAEMSNYDNFTIDHFELALEAMSYLNIERDTLKLFAEKFLLQSNSQDSYENLTIERRAYTAIEEFTSNIYDPDIQLEAYSLLLSIFEDASNGELSVNGVVLESLADNWDDEDDDDDEDEEPKKEEKKQEEKKDNKKQDEDKSTKPDEKQQKSFAEKLAKGLNNIRLGLEGIKYKAKEAGAKEQEISRNIDSSARAFAKAIKNCFVTDRREAIIKGSVIPSFSRCIKNGILLAGLGIVSNTIVIPIIALMAGLAISKNLNKKERLLLLDEIDTELEVVEKEIQNADSNGNMKKYRDLLRYKKELQRQYQRIRYNIRVGKDLIPSDTGVTRRSND